MGDEDDGVGDEDGGMGDGDGGVGDRDGGVGDGDGEYKHGDEGGKMWLLKVETSGDVENNFRVVQNIWCRWSAIPSQTQTDNNTNKEKHK